MQRTQARICDAAHELLGLHLQERFAHAREAFAVECAHNVDTDLLDETFLLAGVFRRIGEQREHFQLVHRFPQQAMVFGAAEDPFIKRRIVFVEQIDRSQGVAHKDPTGKIGRVLIAATHRAAIIVLTRLRHIGAARCQLFLDNVLRVERQQRIAPLAENPRRIPENLAVCTDRKKFLRNAEPFHIVPRRMIDASEALVKLLDRPDADALSSLRRFQPPIAEIFLRQRGVGTLKLRTDLCVHRLRQPDAKSRTKIVILRKRIVVAKTF